MAWDSGECSLECESLLSLFFVRELAPGPERQQAARTPERSAWLFQATHRVAEAEPLMRRALGICVARLGAEHPNSRTFQRNLDGLLAELGR